MRMIRDLLITIAILIGIAFCSYYEVTYTREATVIRVEDEKVFAQEREGYIWDFYGDGFSIGDKVELIMDTNNTDSMIKDDIVKKVRKIN